MREQGAAWDGGLRQSSRSAQGIERDPAGVKPQQGEVTLNITSLVKRCASNGHYPYMPRMADRQLEARIVRAAQQLWRVHGGKSLTLRSVARAAGTTTTTVYKRFENKDALVIALAEMVQAGITAETTSAATIEQAYRRFLAFAEKHPQEYNLLWGPAWPEIYGPGRPRPIKEWLLENFAARFGGRPKDYVRLYYALFLLVHGTATLMSVARDRRSKAEMRDNCLAICDALVANIEVLKKPSPPLAGRRAR